jgi:hypothetical protein
MTLRTDNYKVVINHEEHDDYPCIPNTLRWMERGWQSGNPKHMSEIY